MNQRSLSGLPAGALLLLAAVLASVPAAAQAPLITEFMTGKQRSLPDEDGEYHDWIEIYNASSGPVSLLGSSLTDDRNIPDKWKFPDLTIAPGRFLVVFASEKDRRDPSKPLHTNFRLEVEGELLAFVAADGATVFSQFSPLYPPQAPRVSYGVAMQASAATVLTAGSPVKVFIPTDASLGSTWTELEFDDSGWLAGTTGVGFDKKPTPTFTADIQLDLATPMSTINSTAYIRVPFDVPRPEALSALYLRMKYDDGFVAFLNGREVARRAPAGAMTWNSRTTVRRADGDAIVFEEIVISSHLDAVRPGPNMLAIHGLNLSRTDSDFLIVPELASASVDSVQPAVERYFDQPTPGAPNSAGVTAVAEDPLFSRLSGPFAENFSLTLSASTPGAVIRFTLDRKEPTDTSPEYTAPIPIDRTLMVRARVFVPGLVPSPTTSHTYVGLDATANQFTSNLPIILIESFGRAISEGTFTPAHATIIDTNGGRSSMVGEAQYSGNAALKVRGSSSLGFPKRSYNFELQDEDGDDFDASLFGMPEESDWILYAPYTDKTLMRDVLSYDWSNDVDRWAPSGRFVEVFVHASGPKMSYNSGYSGVYAILEKIKRNERRVSIQKLYRSHDKEPEITGGYILKKDRLDPGDVGISTSRGHTLGLVEPKEQEATLAQKAWIKTYLNQFEAVLYNNSIFRDPENGYAKFIDIDSFIDHHILVEITKNIDGYRLSTFMYKDRGGKLVMGPVWDYNLTLGNANYLDGWKPDGWYYALVSDADYPWYRQLQRDPAFLERYAARWTELRAGQFQLSRLLTRIDDYAVLLGEAQVRNYRKWPILGTYVWPNQFIGQTFQDELNFMKGWLTARVAWMDGMLIPAPAFNQNGGRVPLDFRLEITSIGGTIYYTSDGSDPRLATGDVAPGAVAYTGPFSFSENTRIKARARIAGEVWSGLKEAVFVVRPIQLVITELMFSPEAPPDGPYGVDEFEYIEIQNIGAEPVDLTTVRFSKGVTLDFADMTPAVVPPGGHFIAAKNPAALATRYDTSGIAILGTYTGSLSNSSEPVALVSRLGEVIQDFRYNASWYPETAAGGFSLVIKDPLGDPASWGVKEGWRPSFARGGSPGAEDTAVPGGRQLPGDTTQDGVLNITDAVNLLSHLFLGSPSALPCDGGTTFDEGNRLLFDADGGGSVGLTDGIHILNYLFRDGAPHALGAECMEIQGCPESCAP